MRRAIVEVRDTGEGMPPGADRPRCSTCSCRASAAWLASAAGSGIGLTLARRLVEMNDGTIRATSAGRGQERPHGRACPPSSAPRRPDGSGRHARARGRRKPPAPRILIVEDNADAREAWPCAAAPGEVRRCRPRRTGERGLALARAGTADIVLLDIGLPDVDGYEIARRLKADPATRHLWLLAVTGYGTQDDRRRCLAAGFDEHLAKPVEPEELEALLRARRPRRRNGAG